MYMNMQILKFNYNTAKGDGSAYVAKNYVLTNADFQPSLLPK